MLVLRYLLRSSVPVTGRNVKSKLYEISNFLELRAFTGQGFTFTAAGCKGADGPTKEQCLAEYNFDLADHENIFDMKQRGIQIFTVPMTAVYDFCVEGAGSVDNKASGAIIKGKIKLNLGDKIHIGIGRVRTGEYLNF